MKRGSLTDAAQPHPFQHAHVAIVHSILLLKPPIPQVSLGKLIIVRAPLLVGRATSDESVLDVGGARSKGERLQCSRHVTITQVLQSGAAR